MTKQAGPSLPPLSVGATVLVVEDCLASAEVSRLMSRRLGLRVRLARSLEAARRHLASFRPALIIIDIGLPDGSGVELLRTLAADPASRPKCLAVSADDAVARLPEVQAGADAFAVKPFPSIEDFRAAVAPLLPGQSVETGHPVAAEQPLDVLAQEDMARAREVLGRAIPLQDHRDIAWGALFLTGLAGETGDRDLRQAAMALSTRLAEGQGWAQAGATLLGLCTARLAGPAATSA